MARGRGAVRSHQRAGPSCSSFNGGFKWGDFTGGVLAFGGAFGLVGGQASLIVYSDGTFNVGAWGRDTDPAKQVVAVRQNLQLLVDGGRPTPETRERRRVGRLRGRCRDHEIGGGCRRERRTGVGGWTVSPADLANAIIAAGGVGAMEMDINPDWVHFNSYDVAPDGSAHGNGLFGATGADRFLRPDARDFVAVMVRGTVLPGATANSAPAPIKGEARGG